ncbi:hypothetical protein HNQ85_002732 [Anoxybacillus calidus]|uniref:Uncharacterized protein n=1 Tax=[Anoxybacillus] calidus TaxID=575178 RepID=A0A7W0BVZ4_9BACL|nr:hypothetical protein [Anoxybacillus calidus]MBA2872423.1 hypothetical protein [Anoxybacillus calidus]
MFGKLKEIFKERINIEILSGGHVLTDKSMPVRFINIVKGEQPGEIITEVPFADKKKWILASIDWEESHTRSAGKAAAGAIVGKMVAGTTGAIVGAAMGGKQIDTSKAFLRIRDEEGTEHTLHIKCDEKLYRQLSALLG